MKGHRLIASTTPLLFDNPLRPWQAHAHLRKDNRNEGSEEK